MCDHSLDKTISERITILNEKCVEINAQLCDLENSINQLKVRVARLCDSKVDDKFFPFLSFS